MEAREFIHVSFTYLHSRIVGAGAGTSGDTSLHPVGRGLSFVFKEGLHEVVILLTISLVLYTVIFAWSIKARKRMPTEFEYWQAAMERDLYDDTPISHPAKKLILYSEMWTGNPG